MPEMPARAPGGEESEEVMSVSKAFNIFEELRLFCVPHKNSPAYRAARRLEAEMIMREIWHHRLKCHGRGSAHHGMKKYYIKKAYRYLEARARAHIREGGQTRPQSAARAPKCLLTSIFALALLRRRNRRRRPDNMCARRGENGVISAASKCKVCEVHQTARMARQRAHDKRK